MIFVILVILDQTATCILARFVVSPTNRSAHEGQTYACHKCTKNFKRKDDLKKHEQICQIDLKCPQSQNLCATPHGLQWHMSHHARGVKRPVSDHDYASTKRPCFESLRDPSSDDSQPGPSSYRCRQCENRFLNRRELYLHQMREHFQVGGQLQETPWEEGGGCTLGGSRQDR